jgi:DNA-binding response OmpR family regulator
VKYRIVILANSRNRLMDLACALQQTGCDLQWADSLAAARTLVSKTPPDLVVIDEQVDNQNCIQVAHQLVMTNPLVNLAAISALTEEEFHEASEGLGIMARLPPAGGTKEASALIERLEQMKAMAAAGPSLPGLSL